MIPNIIVIDLTQFGTKPTSREDYFNKLADIRKFLVELGIPTNLDTLAKDLLFARSGTFVATKPWTYQKGWNKIWLTSDTLKIIGYENCDGKHFTQEFLDYMAGIKPVQSEDCVWIHSDYIPYCEEENSDDGCKTLDEVLDKINLHGIDSLSDSEKNILLNTK